jgi:hypothetical protein
MPEFKDWHEPLQVGNFVRVTVREDDNRYIVGGESGY